MIQRLSSVNKGINSYDLFVLSLVKELDFKTLWVEYLTNKNTIKLSNFSQGMIQKKLKLKTENEKNLISHVDVLAEVENFETLIKNVVAKTYLHGLCFWNVLIYEKRKQFPFKYYIS